MPTNTNTRIQNQMQLLLPSAHHAILTNHTCQEKGPLAVLCGDLHHHPQGTIDTIDLVGASITLVYVTLFQTRVLRHSGAHLTPFIQLPTWPQYQLFSQYLTQTARNTGNRLPDNKDMKTAYRDFSAQYPNLVPTTIPYIPMGSKQESCPPGDGQGPATNPTIGPKRGQTRTDHHNPPRGNVAHTRTPHDTPSPASGPQKNFQQMPSTSWACDLNASTTPWPVLHLIARQQTHPTNHLPPQDYAWVAWWFHRTDTNPGVAWDPEHEPQWLFTAIPTWPRPDPTRIAICYGMYEPGRPGKHEHPSHPLHHSCHTPEHPTQTLTCRLLSPDMAYMLHYIYSYLTQGQQEEGLIAVSPRANRIVSKGLGVYANPILQPMTLVPHLTTGLAIYAYLFMNPFRLPQALKPVRTPVAILGSLGVCIYVPASRHWLISYSPIHLT